MKERNEHYRQIGYFLGSLGIIFAIALLGSILDNIFGTTTYLFGCEQEARSIITDFFLVEVQVSFIVVSLCTALSTKSKRVYWEDCFQYRLVSPLYTNFTALSSYIMATLVVGVIWEFVDRCISGINGGMGIIVSFVVSIILMIILSMRMIGANFGEQAIKRELEKELEEEIQKKNRIAEHIGHDTGLKIPQVGKLVQVIMQEFDEKDFLSARENLDLLAKYGLYHDLKRCYDHAKWNQTPEIMEEIDYYLMKKAVMDNKRNFFYGDCPLSFDTRNRLWGQIIEERFDEATVLWMDGDKEKAWEIRVSLYSLLAQAIDHCWFDLDADPFERDEAAIEEADRIKYKMLDILSTFVGRRNNETGTIDKTTREFILLKMLMMVESFFM